MPHLNNCILAGHLTRDPETRYTTKGTAVAEFGLAINRMWKNEAGDKQEEVSFFDCVAFGKTAENIGTYFGKGGAIMVECRAKQETWDDKATGKPRSKVRFIVEKFHFVGDAKKDGDKGEATPRGRAFPETEKPASPIEDYDGDSVPF